MTNYRKAKDDEVPCSLCKWSAVRPESGRLECRLNTPRTKAYAVGLHHTCDESRPKNRGEDNARA